MIDFEIFDAGVKSMSDSGKDDLMPHFIYCGQYYFWYNIRLKAIILTKMKKYGIQSSILTMLMMWRLNLVTKEKVKKAAEGKLKNEETWKNYDGSINDDFERFLINLQNQKEVEYEKVESFFTPKLTDEEMKLVQERKEEHLSTYLTYLIDVNPDVDVEEMKLSDSKSKYVHVNCMRNTIPLTLKTNENGDETKNEEIRKDGWLSRKDINA